MFWRSTQATFWEHEEVFDNVLAFDFGTRSPPDMHCVFPSSPSTSFCRHPIPRLDVDPVIYRHLYGPGEDKNFWKKPHSHLLIPDILGNSRTNLGPGEGTLPGIASPQETFSPQQKDIKSIFGLNLKLLQGHEQKKVWPRDTQGLRELTDASVE